MGRRSRSNQIDWELIEKEFRLGQSTLRQLAATHKVQPSAISRKAKKENWVQDKSGAVKARSEAQLLAADARKATHKATEPTEIDIEVAATVRTNVVLAHRQDALRARTLTMKLLSELDIETDNIELFRTLGEMLAKPDDKGVDKLNELYHKVISLGGRVSNMKALAESLQKVVAIEREAFGIDDPSTKDQSEKVKVIFMTGGKDPELA